MDIIKAGSQSINPSALRDIVVRTMFEGTIPHASFIGSNLFENPLAVGVGKEILKRGVEDLSGFAEFLSDPINGLKGLKQVISDKEIMGQVCSDKLNEWRTSIDNIYKSLRGDGNLNAEQFGRELGGLAYEVGTILTLVGGVVKGSIALAKVGIKGFKVSAQTAAKFSGNLAKGARGAKGFEEGFKASEAAAKGTQSELKYTENIDNKYFIKHCSSEKSKIWTSTKERTAVKNAFEHWTKHSSDFPEFLNARQYIEGIRKFFSNSPKGTLTKIRVNGDVIKYHKESNTFAVMTKKGVPKTMFKPKDGIKYFEKQ